ncbi:hypothetical protein OV450_6880, partial [Actinobacteria bacterium OV450]
MAPGRRVGAPTADYDEGHQRRLPLIRALLRVGGIPVATAREVLRHVDDDSLARTIRLGAALGALPQGGEPDDADEADEAVAVARLEVDRLLAVLGWTTARELGPLSPVHRSRVVAPASLIRLGHPWHAEPMAPYAELMHRAAVRDLGFVDTHPSEAGKAETAAAAAALFQPVMKALHRSARRRKRPGATGGEGGWLLPGPAPYGAAVRAARSRLACLTSCEEPGRAAASARPSGAGPYAPQRSTHSAATASSSPVPRVGPSPASSGVSACASTAQVVAYAPVAAAVRAASASRLGFTVPRPSSSARSRPSLGASSSPRAARSSSASTAARRSSAWRAPRPVATARCRAGPAGPPS